jgi:hypothetical protein
MAWLILGAGLLGGCSVCASPDCRIQQHQEAYNSWPQSVQERVASGQIEPGYTSRMVFVALGAPDETRQVETDHGMVTQWVYWGSEMGSLSEEVIGQPAEDYVPGPASNTFVFPEDATMENYPYNYFQDERIVRTRFEEEDEPGMVIEFRNDRVSTIQPYNGNGP